MRAGGRRGLKGLAMDSTGSQWRGAMGWVCVAGYFCRGRSASEQRCLVCGGRNESCCPDNSCHAGLTCQMMAIPATPSTFLCVPL